MIVEGTMKHKSRKTAIFLSLVAGGIGAHKFYLRNWGWGIAYLLFFWTLIPGIMAGVECFRFLILEDDDFVKRSSAKNKPFSFVW
jgi:TM2 domain-containing membrane protein YozV